MTEPVSTRLKNSCPHCGKKVALRIWDLMPSSDRRRVLKCPACSGKFDLSDGCKIAAMFGGLIAMAPGILLFSKIVRAGHGRAAYVIGATAVVALAFGLTAAATAWLTLRLVPKS